jgi:alkanesulfonate monooxygenase SsuD/methylene tetrahydromethanopterin reductase-like flavin-dependent oxidoreductase (luciferase family)
MPPPVEHLDLDPMVHAGIVQALSCAVIGGPQKVRDGIEAFAKRTGADELMVTSSVWDFGKRKRSFEIIAKAMA